MALTRPDIVATALSVLDEQGLDGLTLRRIADRLGVKAPALYWHLPDKKALVDEMATELMRRAVAGYPEPGTAGWRDVVVDSAAHLRAVLRAHRDGARVFSGSRLTDPEVIAELERPLRVLVDVGFAERDAALAWSTLRDLVVGFVIEEQEVYGPDGSVREAYRPELRASVIDPERHPLAHRSGPTAWGGADERFADAVRFLVDGMAARLA
ncbi:TetR/AcrR family transcriptional regulator C-terminal domain-containing protein [Tsukamurella sp. 8F]|uniref:TetR/AcrR family transcriptional regulator C-terminal domain-containing protein n=1 Tax=unclassified Tsukamurella TaxID=2633480 RepID=UPI0023B95B2D|nr:MULTISPECIES: TetR/AcrR family transcriptional regulator C-terminal domain-containing protein [unclassified Tsukamurella]MDF0528926.1 TetR/AcrR family transcriptional regulator C-terminal domain-containing protein [Tsukamurella sp. 8J]MDF0589465.1 TetR/AcrR family transcriptional regulator C-terminal domain-containing protein [Tsukamurella sp. 8F]